MSVDNKKILMVIAPKDFKDEEYLEPRKIFERENVQVKVASIGKVESIGVEGTRVGIDFDITEIDVQDYDAIVFVGGSGIVPLLDDPRLTGLARDFYYADNKIVAAICVAPMILANAGLLKDKKATCFVNVSEKLEEKGVVCEPLDVVTDGKIITGSGPMAAKNFGEAIIKALNEH